MTVETCPSRDDLADFNAGRLPIPALDSIAQHVSSCHDCQAVLIELDNAADSLARQLRAAGASNRSDRSDHEAADSSLPARAVLARFEQVIAGTLTGASASTERDTPWAHLPPQLGQYRIIEPLRAGGMGAVVKAEHAMLKRTVALKLLPAERFRDPHAVSRFRREIEAIARLDHPNIVRANDAGEHDGIHFLVMELVDGMDLAALVNRCGPLPIADACELIRQAALGLEHAHEHGLVHRDIKPSNIMLDVAGRAKLLDLGLARLGDVPQTSGELTATGQLLGTFDYMAPEQATDLRSVDIRADLYSLGCTLYYLLTGYAPFSDNQYDTIVKKIVGHAKEAAVPLGEFRDDMPDALAQIVARLLEKNPEQRYSEPRALADALTPLAVGANLPALLRRARGATGPATPPRRPSTARITSFEIETSRESARPSSSALTRLEPQPAVSGTRSRWLWAAALLALALFGGAAWWAVPAMIRIATGTGIVEIQPLDADVQVNVLHNGELVQVLDTKTNRKVELLAGKYELKLDGGGDDLRLSTDQFTLTRGDVELVKVTRHPPPSVPEEQEGEQNAAAPPAMPAAPVATVAPNPTDRWPPGATTANPGGLPGLIPNPAQLPNVDRWQLETASFRTGIRSASWSPNGKYIACATSYAGVSRLCILDAATRKLVRMFTGNGDVTAVAWSPDSERIVGIGPDHPAQIWNAVDGVPVRPLRLGGPGFRGTIRSFAWSKDDKWIAVVTDGPELSLCDTAGAARSRVAGRHTGGVRAADFSPDGQWLASVGEDATVRLWNVANQQPGLTLAGPQGLPNYTTAPWWQALHPVGRPMSLAFSPDGRRLAVAANAQVRIWNLPDGSPGPVLQPPALQPSSLVASLSFSPDGAWLAVALWTGATTGEVRLFRAENLEPGPTVPESADMLAWHPNGRSLAVARQFRADALSVYELSNSPPELKLAYSLGRAPLAPWTQPRWTADGQGLVLVRDDRVMMWDVSQMRPRRIVATPPSSTRSRAVSPRGDRVAAGGYQGLIRILNLNSGDVEGTFRAAEDSVGYLAWSPDEDKIAGTSGREQGTQPITVWRLDGKELRQIGPANSYFISWSPDGKWLATRGPKPRSLQLWNAATGEPGRLLEAPGARGVHHVAWIPDGRYVATGSGHYELVRVWEASTGKLVVALPDTDNVAIYALAFSPDGQWLAAGGGHAATELCLWSVGQWDLQHRSASHWAGLGGVAWSPDSRQFATSGSDGLLQIRNLQGRLEALAVLFENGTAASFTAAGQTIYADPETEDELVYLVEADDGRIDLLRPAEFAARCASP